MLYMPYKRYRKRRFYRKKKPMSWGQTALKALKIATHVAAAINPEHKVIDTTATATNLLNTGTVLPLSKVAEGDDYNNRNGRSIKITENFLRYIIAGNISTPNTFVRIILFRDMQNTGSDPTISDILQNSAFLTSPLNVSSNPGRFNILMDKLHTFGNTGPLNLQKRFFIKEPMHVHYDGTANTDYKNGSLFLLYYSNMASSGGPDLEIYNRSSFVDN